MATDAEKAAEAVVRTIITKMDGMTLKEGYQLEVDLEGDDYLILTVDDLRDEELQFALKVSVAPVKPGDVP